MFTGLIEATTKVVSATGGNQSIKLVLKRPESFQNLSTTESIACNGVCLSLEEFDKQNMKFTLGHETLKITGWHKELLKSLWFHLERSLKLGDPVHGHLVTGHVDTSTKVIEKKERGECLLLDFQLPEKQKSQIYEKCCIAINGVSLTVNQIKKNQFQVCLIPETLRKTRLGFLKKGDSVNIETDYYVKGILHSKALTDCLKESQKNPGEQIA